ncbi:MAG: TIGR00289 family protein [Candidatus Micrarchaeota archaeon]|nr:TIGR00289 family protein [Candidatus Micrarchaeota archaeon]
MANAVLYSGGKDSTLALHKTVEMGIKVDLLITMISRNADSYMFHHPNIRPTRLQSESMGIKQAFYETEGEKEEELKDLERALKVNDARLLVTGATYSRYQADRIDIICKKLGIEHLAPIWHIDPMEELAYLNSNFNAIITSVSAEGLDESFLGKRIDKEMIGRLQEANRKYGINMLFEGGEAESFVLDAPLFKKRIEVLKAHNEWKGNSGAYIIDDAGLADK